MVDENPYTPDASKSVPSKAEVAAEYDDCLAIDDLLPDWFKKHRAKQNAKIDRQVYEILQCTERDECPFWVTVDRGQSCMEVSVYKGGRRMPHVEWWEVTAETYDKFLKQYELEE